MINGTVTQVSQPSSLNDNLRNPFTIYSIEQFLDLPKLEWQVDEIVPAGSFGVLSGKPGHGKSFVALDLALRVAAGLPWCGRSVKQGPVVYLLGEGEVGAFGNRVAAWRQAHSLAPTAFICMPAVQFADGAHVDFLLGQLDELKVRPTLMVVDTFAQSFSGLDENQSKDVSLFIAGVNRARKETSSTMLALHHSPKDANQPKELRGHSSLKGAIDFQLWAKKSGDVIDVEVVKSRDGREDQRFQFVTQEITPVGRKPTLVLSAQSPGLTGNPQSGRDNRAEPDSENMKRVVAALATFSTDGGEFRTREWRQRADQTGQPIPESSFNRCARRLDANDQVRNFKKGWWRRTSGGSVANYQPPPATPLKGVAGWLDGGDSALGSH